jgi:hypothetical protein
MALRKGENFFLEIDFMLISKREYTLQVRNSPKKLKFRQVKFI